MLPYGYVALNLIDLVDED